jgi:hypothetical protein
LQTSIFNLSNKSNNFGLELAKECGFFKSTVLRYGNEDGCGYSCKLLAVNLSATISVLLQDLIIDVKIQLR